MDINSMKNIVILKNLPSNMVEEAFIVLKDNVKVYKKQMVDKKNSGTLEEKSKDKNYVVKEAEMIISEYISKIEKKNYEGTYNNKKLKEKYKRLKVFTIFLGMFFMLSLVLILFK